MRQSNILNIEKNRQSHQELLEYTGSDLLVRCLERQGVDTIFAYPGGASLEIHQSLTRAENIRVILPRHEQGGVFAACGYARATGRPGVCMATSGPGATNLISGIADAYLDSTPLIAITGQVPLHMIGRGAFQEVDFFGMTLPIVKHSYLVSNLADLPAIIEEAFHLAQTGRPGPIVIDIPKDIQQTKIRHTFTSKTGHTFKSLSLKELQPIADLISKAERPVLYVGGGVISSDASKELLQFVELTGIPVATTLMGIGAFPEEHTLSLRWLGMHGAAFANWAVSGEFELRRNPTDPSKLLNPGADLLLAFGVRFDDRVTGNIAKFCEHGTIVHIDIDPAELNKNKQVQYPLVGDIKGALRSLIKLVRTRSKPKLQPWHMLLDYWKTKAPFGQLSAISEPLSAHLQCMKGEESEVVIPQLVIQELYRQTNGDAIITTGVGQHQMWAAQFYKFKRPRQLLTSSGLGAMGFGYPAALGAKVAFPDEQVIDIDGDGSFMMNIQELATAHVEQIGAKAIILNNQHLGMVMQWEDTFYKKNRGNTYLGHPERTHAVYPNYQQIIEGFGVKCEQIWRKSQLPQALARMLASKEAYVIEVIVPNSEHVFPFIPAGKTVADMRLEA